MTRQLPAPLRPLAEMLEREHGAYLRNTVRRVHETCAICAVPILPQYEYCHPCFERQRSQGDLADRVGSLVYAVKNPESQTYKIARGYKADRPAPSHPGMMTALIALAYLGHLACLGSMTARPPMQWSVVPSLKHPDRSHPLRNSLLKFAQPSGEVRLQGAAGVENRPGQHRAFNPANFVVDATTLRTEHVVLIDDSWVRGDHAQSAAHALKLAGASEVSVLTVARVLDGQFGPNPEFIQRELIRPFDADLCPWTGEPCA